MNHVELEGLSEECEKSDLVVFIMYNVHLPQKYPLMGSVLQDTVQSPTRPIVTHVHQSCSPNIEICVVQGVVKPQQLSTNPLFSRIM